MSYTHHFFNHLISYNLNWIRLIFVYKSYLITTS